MGHRTSTTPIPKDQFDILISAVIQEEGNEQLLEWSLNDDGTRVIKSNRGIKTGLWIAEWLYPWYAFISPWRLITYVYPLLLRYNETWKY